MENRGNSPEYVSDRESYFVIGDGTSSGDSMTTQYGVLQRPAGFLIPPSVGQLRDQPSLPRSNRDATRGDVYVR